MRRLHVGNRYVRLDDDGFLENTEDWNENVAKMMAEDQGLGRLDKEKMAIISYLRKHYLKFANFPILKSVCKRVGAKSADCVNEEFSNPIVAWKIAGLPKPPNVFFTTFDGDKYFPNPVY